MGQVTSREGWVDREDKCGNKRACTDFNVPVNGTLAPSNRNDCPTAGVVYSTIVVSFPHSSSTRNRWNKQ
jgi:hypothetical protein